MKKLKEVIVFSGAGDPREIKTWSNVPYFLVATLESKGITVHTVNLGAEQLFHRAIQKIVNLIISKTLKNVFYDYSRTLIYQYITKLKIYTAKKIYKNADAFIFTTFSTSASGIAAQPSILFGDWTMNHHINYYLNRDPNWLEKMAIRRENQVIEKADAVFVLFPAVADLMKEKYVNPNIFYNGNVINALVKSYPEVIELKVKQNRLLFVGAVKYLRGALDLIEAFKILKKDIPDLELDIIGIKETDLENLPVGVTCHGYLDKGVSAEAEKYYALMQNARIFINTTPKWGAFSASLEAMYFYTPVIITAYTEFTQTFGEKIDFGSYYDYEKNDLADKIQEILKKEDYRKLCIKAHLAAKEHSWDNYVDKMITKLVILIDCE